MALFDGNGGFFKKTGNAIEGIFKVPGRIIDFGEKVGQQVFGTAEEISRTGRNEGQEFFGGQAGRRVGNFITDNSGVIIIGIVFLLISKFTK